MTCVTGLDGPRPVLDNAFLVQPSEPSKTEINLRPQKFERFSLPYMSRTALFQDNPLERNVKVNLDFPDNHGAPQHISRDVILKGVSLAEDEEVIQKSTATTVRIMAKTASGQGWFGSGSILDPTDGLHNYEPMPGEYFILTNNHVTDGNKYLAVKLPDDKEYWADVVEAYNGAMLSDAEEDVSLLRVILPMSLQTATLGDSSQIRVGEPVYTVGYSLAFPRVVIAKGAISQAHQETGELSEDIQSTAPISPGNSGGPMINARAEIIGTNTYTFNSGEDLTFAKPINRQLEVLRTIWEKGEMVRGSLGFEVKGFPLINRKVSGFPENETGAIVSQLDDSARRAGLKVDDIITRIDAYDPTGRFLTSTKVDINDDYEGRGVLKRWAAQLLPGSAVKATIFRKEGKGYLPTEITVPVKRLVRESAVAADEYGFSVTQSEGGDLVVSGKGLGGESYYLRGVEAEEIPLQFKEFASNMHGIYKLKELLRLVSDRQAEAITLKVADFSNPSVIRRIKVLKRDL